MEEIKIEYYLTHLHSTKENLNRLISLGYKMYENEEDMLDSKYLYVDKDDDIMPTDSEIDKTKGKYLYEFPDETEPVEYNSDTGWEF